jgi:hypothetical protein
MKKFLIERNLPGAGNLSEQELQDIARASCEVVYISLKVRSLCGNTPGWANFPSI